jgi:hypothetical protein
VFGQSVLDKPLMNSVEVHIYIAYTVFVAMWLTTDVNLDVKRWTRHMKYLVNDVVDEHGKKQKAKNRALYNTRRFSKKKNS